MLSLRDPHRAFLIGGGAGGLLAELLKYPDVRIDYCELNPSLVSVLNGNVPNLESTGLLDPRVTVRTIDGRRCLQHQPAARYDLIMIGLPSPTTLQANRYFSAGVLRPGSQSVETTRSACHHGARLIRLSE